MKLIHAMTLCLALTGWLAAPAVLKAEPRFAQSQEREQRTVRQNMSRSQLVPGGTSSGISSQRAASLVKNRYVDSRVLGVTALVEEGLTVYRVRTLSAEGVVKSVYVDGSSGEVFE